MWGSNPTPTLTGAWLMTMVHDILKQIPRLGQPQRKFLATLFVTILVLRGRVNFRNLSRYCDYSQPTIARLPPPLAPRGARNLSAWGPSSTVVRAVPSVGWRFPRSPWSMSHAGALLR